MTKTRIIIQKLERAVSNLLGVIENHGTASAATRLQERETELQIQKARLRQIEAQQASAQIEINPDMLKSAIEHWRQQIEHSQLATDITAMKKFLFPSFITRVKLAYNQVSIEYGFPLELQPQASQAGFAAGTIETTYRTKRKRSTPAPKKLTPTVRDVEIYRRHAAGETVRALAQTYFLSEKRIWGICTSVRKFLRNTGQQSIPSSHEAVQP